MTLGIIVEGGHRKISKLNIVVSQHFCDVLAAHGDIYNTCMVIHTRHVVLARIEYSMVTGSGPLARVHKPHTSAFPVSRISRTTSCL